MDTQVKQGQRTAGPIYRIIEKAEWEKLHQDGAHNFASVADDKGNIIAQCANKGSLQTAKANAAFIVKACNSHYELLEACKIVLNQLERYTDIEGLCLSRRALKAIIAKASA